MAIDFFSSIDLNKNELQNAVVQNLGSAPSSPVEGQIYYDTGDDTIYFRNGSAWVSIGGDITGVTAGDGMTGGGASGSVTLNVVGGTGITANANDIALTNGLIADGSNITSVGTIGTGVWNGTAIASAYLDADTAHLTTAQTFTGSKTFGTTTKLNFRDGNSYIYSPTANDIEVVATTITLDAASDIQLEGTTSVVGILRTTNTTNATSTTDGALRSDGGLSVASDAIIGNDLYLLSDGAKFGLGAGKDVTITHDGGTGGTLASAGNFKVDSTAGTLILDGHTSAAVNSVGNVTLQSTGSAGELKLISAHTAGVALHIDANANSGSIVDIDAGILDVDVTGVTTFDTTEFKLGAAGGLRITDTTASAADTGGKINLVANDGAAMADNHRLGVINFMGAEDASATLTIGASIEAFCDAGWSATENGTRLVLSTTDANASTSAALTLDSDQKASFSADVAIAGDLVVTGTTTTNIVETVTTSSGVVFEGTAADGHDATLKSVVADSDKTYTLPNVTGYVALFAADPSTTTISSTPAELNKLDGATVVVSEINMLDLGSTAVGNAIASKAMVLDANKDYDGVRNFTLTGELDAGSLDISGDADIDGTLETDALTIGGAAVLAQATTSAVGAVELATAAEVLTGTDAARVVTADTLAAKSVVATIAQSSLTDDNRVTITHNLGTADVIVQLFDMTTEANVHADIARTTDDMSTASTSVITVDFGRAPENDIRCLITSLKGATASGTIAYT
tara:strand:+ start:1626 stop:3863 length:2238 start_codon:yes stop_codon:yes gene_type:complete